MQPDRPCKFGATCRRLADNSCNFYHPPGQVPRPRQNNYPPNQRWDKGKSGFDHHRSNPNFTGGQNNFGGQQNQPNPNYGGNNQNNYSNNPNPNFGNNPNSGYNPNYSGPRREPGGFRDRNEDAVQSQLCRNFHIGLQPCKWGEKCKMKHAFLLGGEDGLRRFQQIRTVPNHPLTKLTKFRSGEKDFFAMRNGNEINFFDVNCETKVLGEVFKYSLPDPNAKYNFYDQKNEYIYYSRQNPDTLYEDMGFYNLKELKNYFVANSHQGKITGMAHFSDNVIITTSMLGQLKVWVREGDEVKCHQESTQRLKSNFNPQNAKLELYFVDITEIASTKIICVGTSDGRLLFFFGQDLVFKQVQFTEQYSKVFRVRYATRQEVPTALVLTWNHNKTLSAVLEVELVSFGMRSLVEVRTTEDQPKTMISLFQVVHGYLMVANLFGFISIYNYPDTNAKIGGIIHQNQISEIVSSEDQLKNTNLKIKTMLILQKKTEQRDGSLAIYLLK